MELVQRILGKIVGQEISAEELELVSGGTVLCRTPSTTYTWIDASTRASCDEYNTQ